MDLNVLWIALCAWAGAILANIASELMPGVTFNIRQLLYAAITGFIAALTWSAAYQFASQGHFTIYDIIAAISWGWLTNTARSKVQEYRTRKTLLKQQEALSPVTGASCRLVHWRKDDIGKQEKRS